MYIKKLAVSLGLAVIVLAGCQQLASSPATGTSAAESDAPQALAVDFYKAMICEQDVGRAWDDLAPYRQAQQPRSEFVSLWSKAKPVPTPPLSIRKRQPQAGEWIFLLHAQDHSQPDYELDVKLYDGVGWRVYRFDEAAS